MGARAHDTACVSARTIRPLHADLILPNGIVLPFHDRLGINVTTRSVLMQQICEPMPADVRSIWLMPNSDDEAFLSSLIPDLAERFGMPSARTEKPVAIEAVG